MRMEPDAKPKGSPADLAFMEAMEGMGVKFVDVTPDGSKPVTKDCGCADNPRGCGYETCPRWKPPAPVQTPEGEWWKGYIKHIDYTDDEPFAVPAENIPALIQEARQRFAQEAIEAVEALHSDKGLGGTSWGMGHERALDAAVSAIRNKI